MKPLRRCWKGMPLWLAALALIASVAGAATGIVLSQQVEGVVHVAVGAALRVQAPTVSGLPSGRATFASASDDGVNFSVAADVRQSESFQVLVPIVNDANSDIYAELTLVNPTTDSTSSRNLTMSVAASSTYITNVVKIAPDVWKFVVKLGALGNGHTPKDGVTITVAVGSQVTPGFYTINGSIRVVAY